MSIGATFELGSLFMSRYNRLDSLRFVTVEYKACSAGGLSVINKPNTCAQKLPCSCESEGDLNISFAGTLVLYDMMTDKNVCENRVKTMISGIVDFKFKGLKV